MFHVAKAKIIRHINMVFHVETLAHFSVPKRKVWEKMEHWLVRYTEVVESNKAAHL